MQSSAGLLKAVNDGIGVQYVGPPLGQQPPEGTLATGRPARHGYTGQINHRVPTPERRAPTPFQRDCALGL